MKVRQTSKRKIRTTVTRAINKRNTGIDPVNKTGKRFKPDKQFNKKPERIKTGKNVQKEEMMVHYSPEILKTCKALEVVCIKINKLDKEKRKLINIILNDVPLHHNKGVNRKRAKDWEKEGYFK